MHIIFETPRLFLRRFTEEDSKLILELNSNPDIVKYVHEPVLQTEEEASRIITNNILPQYRNNLGRWAIHTKDCNEFMGWCGLKYLPELDLIDLGYRLKRSAWGKGYATESAAHTLKYGFENLHIKLITGRAHIENTASIKVLGKIGMHFKEEGIVNDCPVRSYFLANPNS